MQKPLVVIAGPTASGKTAVAIEMAEQFGGEVICADSRTVYKGMDIGTAKPTREERLCVPHWGLDLVEPNQRFTAADFKYYAEQKIADIRARGKIPLLVGGTGLYIDAIIFDYEFGDAADEGLRQKLEQLSIEELHEYCNENSIVLPENSQNRRYVIRAIEQKSINTKRRDAPISNSIIVSITTKKEVLRTRIIHRAEQLFTDNVVDEAIMLGKKYGWDSEAMTGNIYPIVRDYIEGTIDIAIAKEKFFHGDWQLARRQMTWLRRNPYVLWATRSGAEQVIRSQLSTIEHTL